MKVLWLGHNLAFPPKGGALQRNYYLLREAAKTCEIHMLAFDQPTTRPPDVRPEDCVRALEKFCAKVNWLPLSGGNVRLNRYQLAFRGLVSREPFTIHWLRSYEMREKLQRTLTGNAFDVVHFDTLGLAQYRALVKGSGTVLNHHDIESSMIARRATHEPSVLRRRYWLTEAQKLRISEQRWCPQFALNIVVSRQEEEFLIDSLPGIDTRVVANGVDTEYFTPRPDPGGRTLLFCGSLDMYPNAQAMRFFFDAIWQPLTRQLGDLEVYVVGRRPPNWLKQLSTVDRRIHVPGFVEDVRPYFRKATAYVCPISDGGGTRLKILDALAMGVPLIGTSFACAGLSLTAGKHVLLAETPGDFIHQINRVLSDLPLRQNLASEGREVVERLYSWKFVGQHLIEAYDAASRARSAETA